MSDSIYAEASLKLYQIPTRKPELVKKKKRTCHLVNFAVLADRREKIKQKQILGFAKKLKKALKYKGNGATNCNLHQWIGSPKVWKRD